MLLVVSAIGCMGVAHSCIRWASPPVTCLLALSLFGLNSIGAELEDPMGEETNDLPYEVFEGAVGAVSTYPQTNNTLVVKLCSQNWSSSGPDYLF